jgi:hypothetical protein
MVELAAIVLAHRGTRPDPTHIVKLLVNSLVYLITREHWGPKTPIRNFCECGFPTF